MTLYQLAVCGGWGKTLVNQQVRFFIAFSSKKQALWGVNHHLFSPRTTSDLAIPHKRGLARLLMIYPGLCFNVERKFPFLSANIPDGIAEDIRPSLQAPASLVTNRLLGKVSLLR